MSAFDFNVSGLDDLADELKTTSKKAHSLNGSQVNFNDLFTAEFMSHHTDFSSWEEMLNTATAEYLKTQIDF